jgi:hypothetical protein
MRSDNELVWEKVTLSDNCPNTPAKTAQIGGARQLGFSARFIGCSASCVGWSWFVLVCVAARFPLLTEGFQVRVLAEEPILSIS